jgi:hypothetical protein
MRDIMVQFNYLNKIIKIAKNKKGNNKLEDCINLFNIEDYHIYKASNKFRKLTINDLYNFEYSAYILFKKDYFNDIEIDEWLEFLSNNKLTSGGNAIKYLHKPFPPNYIKEKIKIIQ